MSLTYKCDFGIRECDFDFHKFALNLVSVCLANKYEFDPHKFVFVSGKCEVGLKCDFDSHDIHECLKNESDSDFLSVIM